MQDIQLKVFSETGRLKQVVVHRPGPEVDIMVPDMMEQLLFDDILYGDLARREHDVFRQVLERVADEVLDIQDLFVEAMDSEGTKLAFIEDFRRLVDLQDESANLLRDMAPADVAQALITGIPWEDTLGHTHWQKRFDYTVRPIPNLLFMRDPAAVVGHGYNINFMATWAREREPLILSYVFRHHPRLRHLKETDRLFDQLTPLLKGEIRMPQSLEGGDTLVLSERVLAVGCSERTSADAVYQLAESLRQDHHRGEGTFDTLLMVLMPKIRSAMHLDTIFTRTSEDECLIYPPFFTDDSRELLNVVKFDLRHASLHTSTEPNLLRALRGCGMDLRPIRCGGDNYIMQQREQWTDGANAFCLAPGVIVLYGRNRATAEELARAGYQVTLARDLLADPAIDLLDGRKYAVLLESSELSRARGGPRCMTMPLSRD
ncbi:arginine deiminase [Mesoterricola sediminis]|uniref:arginine deiminase n=1 Tax=Mesoterricola sediminis TaxID=2927980 RepID=A0AA48GUB0_9BACT|nr:arginine deiminase family protein [Mesoterricola sediminis]BDU77742.1 arginine deiminase [Mesoterricola sediminis]